MPAALRLDRAVVVLITILADKAIHPRPVLALDARLPQARSPGHDQLRTGGFAAVPWWKVGQARIDPVDDITRTQAKEALMRYERSAFAVLVIVGMTVGGQLPAAAEGANYAYIGTYTHDAPGGDSGKAHSEGIYVAKVDQGSGKLDLVQTIRSDNPSFLALAPDQRFLFAINEIKNFEGKNAGSVEAYRIDQESGKIALVNRQALPGPIPAQLAVDPSGKYLAVALYMGGSFAVFPIGADGSLGTASDVVMQHGSGPNKERQEAPHPHSVTFDPAGHFLATADLGIDKVEVFELHAGKLAKVSEAALPPGSGPRHLAFRPDGSMLYVISELKATITALAYDASSGKLGEAIATVSTVPDDFPPAKSTAEIMVHPSGKFLYGSNRRFSDHPDADSIVVFKLDERGVPEREQFVTEDIAFPRAFQLDPTGKWLYACNQKGDSIVQLAIDQKTGKLTPTGNITEVPTPVSLVFTNGR
jgi:6-phosphogluconolactonase